MGHDLFRSIANDYSCDLDGDYENDLNPRQAFGQEGRSFTVYVVSFLVSIREC